MGGRTGEGQRGAPSARCWSRTPDARQLDRCHPSYVNYVAISWTCKLFSGGTGRGQRLGAGRVWKEKTGGRLELETQTRSCLPNRGTGRLWAGGEGPYSPPAPAPPLTPGAGGPPSPNHGQHAPGSVATGPTLGVAENRLDSSLASALGLASGLPPSPTAHGLLAIWASPEPAVPPVPKDQRDAQASDLRKCSGRDGGLGPVACPGAPTRVGLCG